MRRSLAFVAILAFVILGVTFGVADSGKNHQVKQTLPIALGTSGGSLDDHSNAFCCGGTLGAAVNYNGALHILSNNHVLARSGSAVAGEDTLQPGLIDTGCNGGNSNRVGDFIGNVVPLGTGNVDAALSLARSGAVNTSGTILDIGVPCSNIQAPSVGLAVKKSGRTTGLTTGSITSINTTVSVRYQKGCNQGQQFTITYTNQIITGSMSSGGDSGSLLVSNNDSTPNPVGLLYAGSSSLTAYNRAQDVANAFGGTFSFVGTSCSSLEGAVSGPSPSDVDFVRTVKEQHERELLTRPGVIGVGVGAEDEDPARAAIVVYVLENGSGARPKGFPTEIEGVKVRVITTDPIVAQ